MDVKVLAAMYLVGHVVALFLIGLVVRKQLRILKNRPDPALNIGRAVLFVLAAAIGLGTIIPIATDTLVIFGQVHRAQPNLLAVMYSLSNLLTLVSAAAAIYALYITAEHLLKRTGVE